MPITARKNAAFDRGFLTEVVAGGDTAAVGAILADDAVHRNLGFAAAPGQAVVTALGPQVLAGADINLAITAVLATADRVAGRATVCGTHRASLIDPAPTGRSFEIASAWFCRVEDGQIAEIRSLPDGLGLIHQIGATPEEFPRRSLSQTTEHSQP